ncbi:hypothetical protein BKA69DRAFT_1030404 [Paraphysoderma sedebokerense]|nr:hypothetical protein BKA69DRAFT_1030404 [Paraphysoderma sedebokerense]
MKSITQRLSQYHPSLLTSHSRSLLNSAELRALDILKSATQHFDTLYLRQSYHNNERILTILKSLPPDHPNKADYLRYFQLNKGVYDVLDDEKPFVTEKEVKELKGLVMEEKPIGANYYPLDMKKSEFESWLASLDANEKQLAQGFYNVIRRSASSELKIVPFSTEYADLLKPISELVKQAADVLDGDTDEKGRKRNQRLVKFLRERAQSYLSNDYFGSECRWLEIHESGLKDDEVPLLDVTMGPYEVYTDKLFNFRSAFECFLGIRDIAGTKTIKTFEQYIQKLEDNLPIPSNYKNPNVGDTKNLVVVDQVGAGGDQAGPMTSAFNLPNDEAVIKARGAKMILIKNVQQRKFESILTPIAKLVLHKDQLKYLSFSSFFQHVTYHECCHSLGPHNLIEDPSTPIRRNLQELHSALEEAKADIAGLWSVEYLLDHNVDPTVTAEPGDPCHGKRDDQEFVRRSFYVTYLASAFRSIRFGLGEAHGKGQALQLNYLIDEGGFSYDSESSSFLVNFDKIRPAVESLTREIMIVQGDGDKNRAREMLDRYGVVREYTKTKLDLLEKEGVAIDLEPSYE